MLCDSNDRLYFSMAPVGCLAMDMVADVAARVVTAILSSSDDP